MAETKTQTGERYRSNLQGEVDSAALYRALADADGRRGLRVSGVFAEGCGAGCEDVIARKARAAVPERIATDFQPGRSAAETRALPPRQ